MDECRCLIPDENDNCIECGRHIDLPEIGGPMPDLGDIPGICKLIDAAAADFVKAVQENTDPQDPSITCLRLAGSRVVRVPHQTILRAMLRSPYKEAKALGYRGTIDRFYALVCERMPAVFSH
jgi:hypothetical protein